MLKISILCYQTCIKNMTEGKCKLNPYDPFIVNKIINTKKQVQLLDIIKALHTDLKVNNKIENKIRMLAEVAN